MSTDSRAENIAEFLNLWPKLDDEDRQEVMRRLHEAVPPPDPMDEIRALLKGRTPAELALVHKAMTTCIALFDEAEALVQRP